MTLFQRKRKYQKEKDNPIHRTAQLFFQINESIKFKN